MEHTKPLRPRIADDEATQDLRNTPEEVPVVHQPDAQIQQEREYPEGFDVPEFRVLGDKLALDINNITYTLDVADDGLGGGRYARAYRMQSEDGDSIILKAFQLDSKADRDGYDQFITEVQNYRQLNTLDIENLPYLYQVGSEVQLPLHSAPSGESLGIIIISDTGQDMEAGYIRLADQMSQVYEELRGANRRKASEERLNDRELMRQYLSYASIAINELAREDDNEATLRYAFEKVAYALDQLEQHGYSHYDLKPNNIMLDGGVIDFGVMKHGQDTYNHAVGTLGYIHPLSYLEGDEATLDKRAIDRFAYAVTLLDLVSMILRAETFPMFRPEIDHYGTYDNADSVVRSIDEFDAFVKELADIHNDEGHQLIHEDFIKLLGAHRANDPSFDNVSIQGATQSLLTQLSGLDATELERLRHGLSNAFSSVLLPDDIEDEPATEELGAVR